MKTLSKTHHTLSAHHLITAPYHLINGLHITMSLKWPLVPKSDVKQQFTTTSYLVYKNERLWVNWVNPLDTTGTIHKSINDDKVTQDVCCLYNPRQGQHIIDGTCLPNEWIACFVWLLYFQRKNPIISKGNEWNRQLRWPLEQTIHSLKGLAQAKIIKKSVILFRVLNMTIWCKHVHRLELQIFIIFVLRIHQLD